MVTNNRPTDIMNDGESSIAIPFDGAEDNSKSRATDILGKPERQTQIMPQTIYRPVDLSEGHFLNGYEIVDIMAENTGEATLLHAKLGGTECVLKIYHENKRPKNELIERLRNIDCEYVIKAIEDGMYGNRYYEVLPYFANRDVASNLPIDHKTIESIITPSVNEGLKALHNQDIIHRDIKPSNMFYNDSKDKIVLGDFGISSVLKSDVSVRATNMSRTFGYAAPETANGFISKESDYYSFGISLLHLVLGQDPFIGMTDMEILYQTINKKIDIPKSAGPRLTQIISGLTTKDRVDRWGYTEVFRWLNNESVEVKEPSRKTFAQKPYNFSSEYYDDLESLSLAFAGNWENAKKHLYRGLVDKNMVQYGEELASNCMDLKEMKDRDLAVYKLIYLLNPHAPLCYKGVLFNDIESIGIRMISALPGKDDIVLEMVTKDCLTDYLTRNNYDPASVDTITQVCNRIKVDSKYYYALMYILNPNQGYSFSGTKFLSLADLVEFIEIQDPEEVENIASELIDDTNFLMWIYSLGYVEQLEQWLSIYERAAW